MIDTHCHLNLPPLLDQADDAWSRARAAGVTEALVVGVDLASSRRAVDLARRHEGLFAVVGVHPNAAGRCTDSEWHELLEVARSPEVVALGESGLDFHWQESTPEQQAVRLEHHVVAALELDLPLVLHIRDAYPEAARQLRPWSVRGLRGVVHCFAGSRVEAAPFLEWGWPLSFSGIVTYGGAAALRRVAAETPIEQLLLETDAPWLTPRQRGKVPNEPAFMLHTAKELARARGEQLGELVEATSANARRTFALPPPAAVETNGASVQKAEDKGGY